jgi:hypothetical protein
MRSSRHSWILKNLTCFGESLQPSTMTRIEIRFITNEEYDADEEPREYVVIKLIGEDTFSHFYTTPCVDGGEYKKSTKYNKEQLLAWFRGTLRLAVISIDPYKAFLLNFPNVPPFKIPPKKLNTEDQFDSLLDLFSEQLDILDDGSSSRSSSSSSSEEEAEEDEDPGTGLQEEPRRSRSRSVQVGPTVPESTPTPTPISSVPESSPVEESRPVEQESSPSESSPSVPESSPSVPESRPVEESRPRRSRRLRTQLE